MPYRFYIKVSGEIQNAFAAEAPNQVGDPKTGGWSLCYRFRFKGAVNNDPTGKKEGAAVTHEPLSVIKPWGAASPQFMAALWQNEVLDSVTLLFVHADGTGKEEVPFQEIELNKARVTSVEHLAGEGTAVPDGAPAQLEEITFRFEEMHLKNHPGSTAAKYDWKHRG